MHTESLRIITVETQFLHSNYLKRNVHLNIYFPSEYTERGNMHLLLINDGQDLKTMHFENILSGLYMHKSIQPVFCVGIECGTDRKNEYGTAHVLDYKGRGAKSGSYQLFILEELIPFLRHHYIQPSFHEKSFCGFSLGGLSALDIVWNHPREFKNVGVFSGSLWWRSVSQDSPAFNEETDRIIHRLIANGTYYPWLKFFFETGTMDETADRNHNGIIDSIDDTLALIEELRKKGYDSRRDIHYLELKDGKHDVETWGRAFPEFLKWCF